jgi:hypothetical protein
MYRVCRPRELRIIGESSSGWRRDPIRAARVPPPPTETTCDVILAYLCPTTDDGNLTAQLGAISSYCEEHALGSATVFADGAAEREQPWHRRPAGKAILARLVTRDRVILGSESCDTTLADYWAVIRMILAAGASVTFLNPELTVRPGDEGTLRSAMRLLCLTGTTNEDDRRALIRLALWRRKADGRRYTRHPGYGRRWFRGRKVPDDREQTVIDHIRQWRRDGFTWAEITTHLRTLRVETKDGNLWTTDRVRRAVGARD